MRYTLLVALIGFVHFANALPAFRGAQGFGADTTHARGKPVCVVTKLTDQDAQQNTKFLTPGEFRYCLAYAAEQGGAYILFNTSGTIKLARSAFVPSNVYIAGQSSLGGIAIEAQSVQVKNAHDVVIRHIRHREAAKKGDAFIVVNSRNVILDHISVSFFKDGAVDIVDNSENVTVQWSHMGDSMDSGSKNERYHGQPNLLRSGVDRVSFHHNLYTHGHSRMPLVQHSVREMRFLIEFSNNVIYNYGKYPSRFAALKGRGNVIGNYYIPGQNTHGDKTRRQNDENESILMTTTTNGTPPILVENNMSLFLKDNLMLDGTGHDASIYTDKYGKQIDLGEQRPVTSVRNNDAVAEVDMVASRKGKIIQFPLPFRALTQRIDEIPLIETSPAAENVAEVLRRFGALPRDNTDQRLVAEVINRTGGWKYAKPSDNNDYVGKSWRDRDHDGLPDSFETAVGKNIQVNGRDVDANYDNMEIYLDERAKQLESQMPHTKISL